MTPAEKLAERLKLKKPSKFRSRMLKNVTWNCRVRDRRLAHNLTLREVAEACGISHTSVYFAENGKGVTLIIAYKLAKLFGCTIEELWTPKDEQQ